MKQINVDINQCYGDFMELNYSELYTLCFSLPESYYQPQLLRLFFSSVDLYAVSFEITVSFLNMPQFVDLLMSQQLSISVMEDIFTT